MFSISNMELSSISENNEDVYFLMHNSFNDLYQTLERSSNLYVIELGDRSEQKQEICLIIFIINICAMAILIMVILPVVASVNRQKDKVLSLFCEIDDSNIRRLIQKCESFLNKLQSEDNNDDMESNEEVEVMKLKEEEEDFGLLSGSTKKVKSAKN